MGYITPDPRMPGVGLRRFRELTKAWSLEFQNAADRAIDEAVGTEHQLDLQSIDELNGSLQKIDAAIDDPEVINFNWKMLLRLEHVAPSKEAVIREVILPQLLERKSYILRRIAIVNSRKQVSDIRDVVAETVQDADVRESLLKSIESIAAEAMARSLTVERQAEITDQQRERSMRLEVELKERRSRIYRSWIERESVASIVGAILLLGLGVALVVAMFIGTTTSEVVTSSFLLILGYFFGQSTVKASASPAED